MAEGTASVVVGQPVDVVWDFITEPANLASVLPGILSVRADKAPPYEIGDLWHGRARFFGMTYDWTGVFTRVVEGEVMEFRSTESRFPFITTDTLEEVPGGTRYTCRAIGEPLVGGRPGRVIDVAMSRIYERSLRRHLSGLPRHVDAWAARRRDQQ